MASKRRKALGAGLDSLIPSGDISEKKKEEDQTMQSASEKEKTEEGPMKMVRLASVEPDRNQPRKYFQDESLNELADSVKRNGLIQPIIVTANGSRYTIVAGERRWRACQIAGLKEIPVIVREFSTTQEKVEYSLIENIQREDLNPVEEADAYRRLVDEFHLTQEEIAERVSKSRAAVANTMRLLKLSTYVQDMIINGKLSMGHARALIPVEDEEVQKQLADRIVAENLTVRDVERLVKNIGKDPKTKKEIDPSILAQYKDLTNKISESLSMKVDIKPTSENKGKIVIEYASTDDFEKLMERIMS